jgi:hypothetical protein
MTPQEIIELGEGLPLGGKRHVGEDYVDVVLDNNHVEPWTKHLESLLGPPYKPPGHPPDPEARRLTRPFGGIRHDQTLYRKDADGVLMLAFLWPWQNRLCTTLKIFPVTPERGEGNGTPYWGKLFE